MCPLSAGIFLNFLEQILHSTMFWLRSGSGFVVTFVRCWWIMCWDWNWVPFPVLGLGLGAGPGVVGGLTCMAGGASHSLDSRRICSISWNCCVSVVVIFVSFSFSRQLIPVNTNFVPLIEPSQLSEPSDFSSKSLLVIELAGETSLSSLLEWWFSRCLRKLLASQ